MSGVFDLYAITPERGPAVIERVVARALEVDRPERVAVLLRAHHLPPTDRLALGHALRARTRARSAALLVSADLALCEALGADGVQLPERGPSVRDARAALPARRLIGASRHDAAGLERAAREGASFATLSPVHASPGKGEPLGPVAFGALASACALPVVALGGIEPRHARALIAHGAAAVAAIRAVFDAPDPAVAVAAFLTEIDGARALTPANAGARGR